MGYAGTTYFSYDPWDYEFRNCTSYEAEKISQEVHGRSVAGWGNAASWASSAQKAHYSLDPVSAPQVGDVAVWTLPAPYGHVAYVYAVSGSTAYFDEYNTAETGAFSSNRTSANNLAGAPNYYVHMGTPSDSEAPSVIAPHPAVVQRGNGETDVLAVGTNGALYYYYNALGSPTWNQLTVAAGGIASAPAVVQRGNGETDVLAVGTNGALYYYYNALGSPTWNQLTVAAGGLT